MHSRIFNVSKTIEDIEDNFQDESGMYDKIINIADYVSDDTDMHEDLEWMFGKDVVSQFIKHENGGEDGDLDDFYEVPYSVIKEFVSEFKKNKVQELEECLRTEIQTLLDYYTGETADPNHVISQTLYNVSQSFDDRFGFYVFNDYCLMSLNNAVITLFDTLEDGKPLYFHQSFDYHY